MPKSVFKLCPEIMPVKKNVINSSFNSNWGDVLNEEIIDLYSHKEREYNPSYIYYGVGIITGNSENTKLYKIYPNIVKTATINEGEDLMIDLKVSGNSSYVIESGNGYTVGSAYTEFDVNVDTVVDGITWATSILEGGNWITVEPNSGVGYNSAVTITVSENDDSQRIGKIKFFVNDEMTYDENNNPRLYSYLEIRQDEKFNEGPEIE
jgi:phosphohistidine swiveling domain-containing protein